MIHLTVNGRAVELEGPVGLVDYLHSLPLDPRAVAVEVNDRILDRADFETTTLADGDRLEVVRMVGGGRAPQPAVRRGRSSLLR
ncbi:MAG: sulfur carrier protein ThiS [Candidatus Dormibacteraceae bacterium]